MALTKRTYVDDDTSTPITAANLNAIQDEIINNCAKITNKSVTDGNTGTFTIPAGFRGLCYIQAGSGIAYNGLYLCYATSARAIMTDVNTPSWPSSITVTKPGTGSYVLTVANSSGSGVYVVFIGTDEVTVA